MHTLEISKVANGYILRPAVNDYGKITYSEESIFVFNDFNKMSKWLKDKFEKV